VLNSLSKEDLWFRHRLSIEVIRVTDT